MLRKKPRSHAAFFTTCAVLRYSAQSDLSQSTIDIEFHAGNVGRVL
jgi:hypothetical protein